MQALENPNTHRRRQLPSLTNPYIQKYAKILIADPKECPSPIQEIPSLNDQVNKEFYYITESLDSSFCSPLDTEIVQIQNITCALESGIKKKLRDYKRFSLDFTQQHKMLKGKVESYKNELDSVKGGVDSLVHETAQTHQYIKQLRESLISRDSRGVNEDIVTSNTFHEINVVEAVRKLQEDVESVKSKLECSEEMFRISREESKFEFERTCLFDRPKRKTCSCTTF